MLFTVTVVAQKPASTIGLTSSQTEQPRTVAPNNSWVGGTLSHIFNSDDGFADNILFNTRVIYMGYSNGSFNIPIMGNVSIPVSSNSVSDKAFALTDNGISLGLYPYYVITKPGLNIVPNGEVSFKVHPGETFDLSKRRLRVYAGCDFQIASKEGNPLTINGGVFHANNANIDMKNISGLEATVIIPIADKTGLLIDLKSPFDGKALFNIGFIVGK